jgi:hypothetical protein
MAGSLEFGTDIGVVEDLAVVGDPHRVVFVGHRLAASDEVDDAKAPVAKGDFTLHVKPRSIGSAVRDDVGHRAHYAHVGGSAVGIQEARYAAHDVSTARRPLARGPASEAARR